MRNLFLTVVATLALTFAGCTNQPVSDATITTKVKTKLAADTNTSAMRIEVDTSNGVVTLSGAAPTQNEKASAERLAKATEDVRSVVNNITVAPATTGVTTADDRAAGAARDAGDAVGDAAVLAKIKAQYVANGIIGTNVDVKDGAVMLKGQVESAAEKTKAEQIAKQTDGVKSVKNTLVIKKG